MTIFQVVYQSNGIWVKWGPTLSWPFQVMPNANACAQAHPNCRVGVVRGSYEDIERAIDQLNHGISPGVGFEGAPIGAQTTQGESAVDVARRKMEEGEGGDHDVPTRYTLEGLPAYVLGRWVTLQARVTRGELVP